jgi:hypothetical protein
MCPGPRPESGAAAGQRGVPSRLESWCHAVGTAGMQGCPAFTACVGGCFLAAPLGGCRAVGPECKGGFPLRGVAHWLVGLVRAVGRQPAW